MKFVVFVILAVVAVAQAKYLIFANGLSAAMDRNEIGDDMPAQAAMLTEQLFIPMPRLTKCNNDACSAACHALGYRYGTCVSDSTCNCHN